MVVVTIHGRQVDYDPERDSSGAIGHALASTIWEERYRASLGNSSASLSQSAEDPVFSKIARVAITHLPTSENGSPSEQAVKRRLKSIRDAGYSIQPYAHLSRQAAWNYLNKVRSAIYAEAQSRCPSTLAEVVNSNRVQEDASQLWG